MTLMNMTVNKGEKISFFSQSEFARILSRVDTFLFGLCASAKDMVLKMV